MLAYLVKALNDEHCLFVCQLHVLARPRKRSVEPLLKVAHTLRSHAKQRRWEHFVCTLPKIKPLCTHTHTHTPRKSLGGES